MVVHFLLNAQKIFRGLVQDLSLFLFVKIKIIIIVQVKVFAPYRRLFLKIIYDIFLSYSGAMLISTGWIHYA